MIRPTLAALAAALAAAAPPAAAQSILQACAPEIETHCQAVEPGHGRLFACLYAHETALSDACDAATGEMSDLIDMFFETVHRVHRACGRDAAEHCSDVTVGGGRMLACLRENAAAVSPGCTEVIDTLALPSEDG